MLVHQSGERSLAALLPGAMQGLVWSSGLGRRARPAPMPAAGAAALRCAVGQCLNASCVLPLGSLSCGLLGVGLLASPPLWGRAGRSGRGRLWCTEGGREAAGRLPRSLLTSGPLLVWQPSGACSRRRAACRVGLCRGGPACARVAGRWLPGCARPWRPALLVLARPAGHVAVRASSVRRWSAAPLHLDLRGRGAWGRCVGSAGYLYWRRW
jgi:hypothetical protein